MGKYQSCQYLDRVLGLERKEVPFLLSYPSQSQQRMDGFWSDIYFFYFKGSLACLKSAAWPRERLLGSQEKQGTIPNSWPAYKLPLSPRGWTKGIQKGIQTLLLLRSIYRPCNHRFNLSRFREQCNLVCRLSRNAWVVASLYWTSFWAWQIPGPEIFDILL